MDLNLARIEEKDMKFNCHSDDIVMALMKVADVYDLELMEHAERAVYYLKTLCENDMNDIAFRHLWCLLEAFTDNVNSGNVKVREAVG